MHVLGSVPNRLRQIALHQVADPDRVLLGIGGSGPVTITEFSFTLFAKSGQPKQIWLDNLDLRDPAGGGSVALRQWREIVSN